MTELLMRRRGLDLYLKNLARTLEQTDAKANLLGEEEMDCLEGIVESCGVLIGKIEAGENTETGNEGKLCAED